MALEKQPQNLNAQFIGTGEFRFAEGFTTPGAALNKAFRDFQNLKAFTYQMNSDKKVLIGSVRGLRRERGTRVTLARFGYQFKTDDFTAPNTRYLIYGDPAASNYTQVVRAAAATDAIATPAKGPWYQLTVGGNEVKFLTAVAIVSTPSVVEDVDYVVDYVNGYMRWITTPPGTITSVSVTAAAITASDPLSLKQSVPLVTPIRKGMGQVLLFDRIGASTDLFYEHRDFYCEVMASGNTNVDGTNESEITIDVKVLTPFGTVRNREDDF